MVRYISNANRTQRQLVQLAGLLCCFLLLAACNNNQPTPTPAADNATSDQSQSAAPTQSDATASAPAEQAPLPTATPEPLAGRLVLWHSWAGADGDALGEILASARQRYPELIIDTLFVAHDNLAQSYAEAVAAGEGPDLLLAPNWWLGDLVNTGAVAPVGGAISDDVLQLYWPATLENLRWNGQLYGLPITFELVSLYYNRALVSADALPATTDEMLALVQQNPSQGSGLYTSLYHLYWGIPAYGGRLLDDDGTVVLDRSNGAADYLTWLATMDQTQGNFVDVDYGMLIDRFKKSEYAFFVDGPWSLDELRAALGDDLGVAMLPAGPAGPARPWLSADGVFMNPNASAEQQRLALALAQHLTNAESGTTLGRIAHRLPAHRNASIVDDPLLLAFAQQAETAHPMPTVPEMDEVWGYGGDMLHKVLNGVADPVETVVETTALINEANSK